MKEGKRKRSTTNFITNKEVVRETGESHPPAEDKLFLYGGFELDEQIDWLVDTIKNPKVNFDSNSDDSEPEKSDIANDFSPVEKQVLQQEEMWLA